MTRRPVIVPSRRAFPQRSASAWAAVACAALVASACTTAGTPTADDAVAVPSATAPTTTADRGEQPRTLDEYRAQQITWGSCDGFSTDGFDLDPALECARAVVPLDYEDPTGPTASLALSRSAATGDKVGSMLVNPGGPGASGLSTATVAQGTDVQSAFDVIGFDPRGVGASVPAVRCDTPQDFDAERADPDVDTSPEGIAETEAENRAYAQRCADRNDPVLLEHLTSADVARDMDVIRAALGDRQLTYLGFSYGTRLGYTYAELFPHPFGRWFSTGRSIRRRTPSTRWWSRVRVSSPSSTRSLPTARSKRTVRWARTREVGRRVPLVGRSTRGRARAYRTRCAHRPARAQLRRCDHRGAAGALQHGAVGIRCGADCRNWRTGEAGTSC